MLLSELIDGDGLGATPDVEVGGITADSREVAPGYLFAALAGTETDGARFIADAVAGGAVAVLAALEVEPAPAGVAWLRDANPRRRLALMAARFYGRQPETIAAVTGTNGKSSIVAFTRQIWQAAGLKAGSLGTLGVTAPGYESGLKHTTPDPVVLHRELAAVAEHGIDYLAMEASSHGLDQHRLDGVAVQVAAFTNLSRDHLDYHPDADSYLAAKLRLFEHVMAPGGAAVLNADMDVYDRVAEACRARGHRVLGYGCKGSDFRLADLRPHDAGQHVTIELKGRTHAIDLPLVGRFQATNALAALGLAVETGVAADVAVAALGQLVPVPGRIELVAHHPSGAPIYDDYAHTPDALKTILVALRPHTARRLIVLFGCGGDRDRGKRPQMGGVAASLADKVYVTDDNPRTEDAASIRAEVLVACPDAVEVGDRAQAIRAAVAELGQGDLLVVAGKGHEQGQIIGDKVIPFDDADQVRQAVAAIGEKAG